MRQEFWQTVHDLYKKIFYIHKENDIIELDSIFSANFGFKSIYFQN
jgi:hypothetical protein